ncbi:hypothetical protein AYO49_05210 [Verrucomicrobiaceae bacterium SCGC AG-212-N21]|nr:hypothetical protein AYO49_05210 [Verrucomicrobiaceae bacterium SCGC AG-212-N21]
MTPTLNDAANSGVIPGRIYADGTTGSRYAPAMISRLCPTLLLSLAICDSAHAAAPAVTYYFDDTSGRHAKVTENDFGKVSVEFRMTAPGASVRWSGEGTRKDKELTFSPIVGEDQERGTVFLGKASESRLEVGYKPGQKMPVDNGINGEYRRISEDKRLSLAKKEAGVADEALAQALKTTPRNWPSESRSAAADWKGRWPDLRSRWLALVYKPTAPAPTPSAAPAPTKTAPPFGTKAAEPVAGAPTADYWVAHVETTANGIGFINTPLDKTVPPNWDGEYDDGFGGHVSLRLGADGDLRVNLTCSRGAGEGQTGELFLKISKAGLGKEKSGELTASHTHKDPELKPEDKQAVIKLRKTGHFVTVETQNAQRYCGRAWFDGIYRWGPIPTE